MRSGTAYKELSKDFGVRSRHLRQGRRAPRQSLRTLPLRGQIGWPEKQRENYFDIHRSVFISLDRLGKRRKFSPASSPPAQQSLRGQTLTFHSSELSTKCSGKACRVGDGVTPPKPARTPDNPLKEVSHA